MGDAGAKTNKIDFEIAQIKKDENGRVVVIGKPDEKTGIAPQITLPAGSDYQLSDASGKTWTLDEQGEVTSVGEKADTKLAQNQGKSNLPKEQPKPENFQLEWNFSQSEFAFDASGEIPYKALVKGKEDTFKVAINQKNSLKYSFHFNVIPYKTESFNREDEKNRYYYREKTYIGGFEVGIAGNVKQTIWEIPLYKLPLGKKVKEKLKEYIKLEVFVEASANLQGEIKGEIKYKKYPNEKEFKEQSSTFISEMTMPVEFGAGADAKLLKKNDYLHFNATASGKVNTKLLYIRWRNDEGFDIGFLREDVNLDFKVDVSGSFLGFKLETAPFYQRILLMKKQQQNGKQ